MPAGRLSTFTYRIPPPHGRLSKWSNVALGRFLVHDRDSCYGATFDRRVGNIGIAQVRTPFRSPRANAIAERWVRSVRTECLDHVFIFNQHHLQKVLAEYVGYFND